MIVCLIQARSTSTRWSQKCLEKIYNDKTPLDLIYTTAKSVIPMTFFIVPDDDHNIMIELQNKNYSYFHGPFEPLARYVKVATALNASYIIRLTADCPFLDVTELHYMASLIQSRADFISNAHPQTRRSIDGNDIEIMSMRCLLWLDKYSKDGEREHVTQHIYNCDPKYITKEGLSTIYYSPIFNYNKLIKTSLDTKSDYDKIKEYLI
jgi:spore coat polysaccharide biosynthesis protein SpsF